MSLAVGLLVAPVASIAHASSLHRNAAVASLHKHKHHKKHHHHTKEAQPNERYVAPTVTLDSWSCSWLPGGTPGAWPYKAHFTYRLTGGRNWKIVDQAPVEAYSVSVTHAGDTIWLAIEGATSFGSPPATRGPLVLRDAQGNIRTVSATGYLPGASPACAAPYPYD